MALWQALECNGLRQPSVNLSLMDSLFSLLGTAACIVLLGSVMVMIVALFLPKQQRSEVFRRIGRWLQGF